MTSPEGSRELKTEELMVTIMTSLRVSLTTSPVRVEALDQTSKMEWGRERERERERGSKERKEESPYYPKLALSQPTQTSTFAVD